MNHKNRARRGKPKARQGVPGKPPRTEKAPPSRLRQGVSRLPPRIEKAPPARVSSPKPTHGTWLYGIHTVLAALANTDRACHRLLLTPDSAQAIGERLAGLRRLRPGLPEAEILSRDQIASRLATEAVHQGIALLAGPPAERDLGDICRAAAPFDTAVIVVLDQVEDPRNVGAVLRSAAAFGALAVVVTERHAPQQTAALAKAASGALEAVPLVRVTNLVRALDELKEAGFWTAGLDAGAEKTLNEAGLSGKTALVLGAEGKGLRRLTRESCDLLVRIPMAQAGASLNVSNAAAVALYALASGAKAVPKPKL